MEGIIKFSLPEDQDRFTMAINGSSYWSALWEIQSELRNATKYNKLAGYDHDLTGDQVSILYKVQEMFQSILEDKYINLDEIS